MPRIIPLSQADMAAVESLLDAAFGTDRRQRTAYRLRDGVQPIARLSFAAIDEDELVGSIQCWPVALYYGAVRTPLTLVGPVAVAPRRQRGGIGRLLMAETMQAADRHGCDALTIIGDPEYYGRFFGFSAEATMGWELPGPVERHRLLARIDRPGGVPAVGRLGPDAGFASRATTA